MARLEGKKTSPMPLIAGLALLALVGVGGYYAFQNRGADAVFVAPGEVNVVDNKAGNMASNGDVDANAEGNSVTISSSAEGGAENAASAEATPDNTAHENAGKNSGGSDTGTTGNSAISGANAEATNGQASSNDSAKGVVAERSKTIKNDKTKTTVMYQKKIHQDGSVSHSKTTSGSGATSSATPNAQ